MLGGAPPPSLDLSALLPFIATAVLVLSGFVVLLRSASSRYFAVEAPFGSESEGFEGPRPRVPMSIGRVEEEEAVSPRRAMQCSVCGNAGTKVCAGCKTVRYCSLDCQSKHWKEEHKSKCRRKSSGSTIALIPGHSSPVRGAYKVLGKPKKILFPYDEFVKLFYWDRQAFPPCGLLNCGNSCFANVVLQCLACTRPLVAYLLEGSHSRECRRNDWCFLCEIQSHIQRVNSSMQPFSPMSILSRLPSISSNLGYGRQEDAHEFMRFAIDRMQSVCLDEYGGEKALDASTQETTLVQHVFGGHLRSQVICTSCNQVSDRYENMMDLTVEIQGDAESLEHCLNQFTAKEWLDGENKYKCDGCNGYVKALKRLTVHQAPNILTIALKRFQSGRFGKLNKRVVFPETLDLGPYMSSAGDTTNLYSLYAVVVHLDMLNASFFGHYICYTKDFCGHWYRIDDCKVAKVDIEEVLSQGAYMLLYSRMVVRKPRTFEPVIANGSPAAQVVSLSSDHTDGAISMEFSNGRSTVGPDADPINETKMDVDVNMPTIPSALQAISSSSMVNPTESTPSGIQSDELIPLKGESVSINSPREKSAVALSCMDSTPNSYVSLSDSCWSEQTRISNPTLPTASLASVPDTAAPLASVGCPIPKEARPLFSRGFLDKPLKKKPLPKGSRIERVTRPIEMKNGGTNGFCDLRQVCDEKEKSGTQFSGSPNGAAGNIVNGNAEDHTQNGGIGLPNEIYNQCNGHLENGSSHSNFEGSGPESFTSHTSLHDEPHTMCTELGEIGPLENGHTSEKMDINLLGDP